MQQTPPITTSEAAHAQRADADAQAMLWLCAIMAFGQLWIYTNGVLLTQAGSAIWWAAALSAVGGLLAWAPTMLLLRCAPGAGLGAALQKAIGEKPGNALCAWLGALLLLDALACQHALIDLCTIYLLPDMSNRLISLLSAGTLGYLVFGASPVSVGRYAFYLRGRMILGFFALCVLLMFFSDRTNLLPVAGHGMLPALGYGALSGSALCSVFAAACIPVLAQGQPQPSARRVLLIPLCACALTVVVQVSMALARPPYEVPNALSWATHMMVIMARLKQQVVLYAVFALLQVLLLTCAAQGALAYGQHLLTQPMPAQSPRWIQAAMALLLLLSAWFNSPGQEKLLVAILPWRLPAVVVPLWIAAFAGLWRARKEAKACEKPSA